MWNDRVSSPMVPCRSAKSISLLGPYLHGVPRARKQNPMRLVDLPRLWEMPDPGWMPRREALGFIVDGIEAYRAR
jgi:hypothetical protein